VEEIRRTVDGRSAAVDAAKDGQTAMSSEIAAAFFDLDGTLVSGDLMSRLFARVAASTAPDDIVRRKPDAPREQPGATIGWRRLAEQVQRGVALFAGQRVKALDVLAEKLLPQLLATCVHPGARHLLARHRGAGHPLVLVTANAYVIARVAADWFGMDHVLATRLEIKGDAYTGEIAFGAWGARKAEAMTRLAQANGYDLASSYAYADSSSDADMLELVGNATVVHPDDELRAMAELNSWPELDLRGRLRPLASMSGGG
jgi:HAD superfamily hydrolase (TIGR01490 family)